MIGKMSSKYEHQLLTSKSCTLKFYLVPQMPVPGGTCNENVCGHAIDRQKHRQSLKSTMHTTQVIHCQLEARGLVFAIPYLFCTSTKCFSVTPPTLVITLDRGFNSVVTHRLGSGTGSGCKYRELVSEVRQGAVLNLFLPRMRRTVDFQWREG